MDLSLLLSTNVVKKNTKCSILCFCLRVTFNMISIESVQGAITFTHQAIVYFNAAM